MIGVVSPSGVSTVLDWAPSRISVAQFSPFGFGCRMLLPPLSLGKEDDDVAFAKLLLTEPALATHKFAINKSARIMCSFVTFLWDINAVI